MNGAPYRFYLTAIDFKTDGDTQIGGKLAQMLLKDPSIWLNQCKALIDPREMVEIRHELNLRRQSLRESIDYNSANRDVSKNEIDTIIKEYPEYAGDVMGIVSSYNRRVKVS